LRHKGAKRGKGDRRLKKALAVKGSAGTARYELRMATRYRGRRQGRASIEGNEGGAFLEPAKKETQDMDETKKEKKIKITK